MELVFATHNLNKIDELRAMIPENYTLLSLTDIGYDKPIAETASTLEGNALIKAQTVFKNSGIPSFADDTGLFVDVLDGAPGVHSARYAGENADARSNIRNLLNAMRDHPDRKAHFRTVIAFAVNSEVRYFEGRIDGNIASQPRGKGGFGYDPVFIPEGYELSFAEIPAATKNKISHRALAFSTFHEYLSKLNLS